VSSTIYYLQWHEDGYEVAKDRFHQYHVETPETLAEPEFDRFYDEVATVQTEDLEQLYAEWNRGSGYESDAFLEEQVRSLSVGDVVEHDETYYMCASIGWDEIDIVEGGL